MATKQTQEDGILRLKAALKAKKPDNLYVLFGEEDYLRTYYLQMLQKQLISGAASSFNYHRFSAQNITIDALEDALEALPMMAERTMVQVDDWDFFKLPEAQRSRLAAILEDLPEYTCLVFLYDTLPYKPDKRMKKLYAALTQHGVQVEFRRQNQRELVGWVRRHFLKNKREIDDQLCQYLIYLTGGSMSALANEIEKICTGCESIVIARGDIDAVVEPVLDAVVFEITDAICSGDYGLALAKLRAVLQMQQEPVAVLGAIGNTMRRLRCASVLSGSGQGVRQLCTLCGIPDYPARKTMDAARRMTRRFCDQAVLLCAETDYQMKTSYDDPVRLLELLLLRLSEEARHG